MKKILFTALGIKAIIFIVIVVTTILTYHILKKRNGSSKFEVKKISGIVVFLAIIFYSLFYFPIDLIINFKTVEEAFNFQHPEGKLLKKKIYKDTAFVYGSGVCNKRNSTCLPNIFTIYIKKNSKWYVQDSYTGYDKDTKYLNNEKGSIYSIKIIESKKNNITGIFIWDQNYKDKPNLTENTKIEDSNGVKYKLFDNNKATYETIVFLGIVEGKLKEDYSITIDGETFKYKDIKNLFSTIQDI